MQYTTLGKTGLKVSRLGFGCMRLPMKSAQEVDRDLALPLLHRAVDLGVTYFDTAVGYCGGDSQRALGEAMEDMRDKVVLSTKNPHYDKADTKGWWQNLEDSLERLRTDHIDIYNFHGMSFERYEMGVAGEDGLYKEVLKAKEQGMVRHICHSFHGSLESLKNCVATGLFQTVTVQYNLLDQSLEEGIAAAHAQGMGVVIMGPVGGGRLGYPSERAADIATEVKSTPELALRFVLSNPHVSVALSGMSDLKQLEENVATVDNSGDLSQADHHRIEEAIEERKKLAGLYCTGCNYCMPCPEGVDIPANFEILNTERIFGLTDHARARYAALGGQAALCRLCNKCVPLCPQDLAIPERLGDAVTVLDGRSGSVGSWAELRGAEAVDQGLMRLALRCHVKNFTDQSYERVRVALQPHREEQLDPGDFEIGNLAPFARRHRDVAVLTHTGAESYSIDTLIEANGSRTLDHYSSILAVAHRVGDYRLGDPTRRVPSIHVPGPFHPVHSQGDGARGHRYDFSLAFDDQRLYVWMDVEDDLLCQLDPAEEAKPNAKADGIRVFLDARSSGWIGAGAHTDGTGYVTIFPRKGLEAAAVLGSREMDVHTVVRATPEGYVLDLSIPWSAFGTGEEDEIRAPAVLGFDIAMVSHDGDGREVLRLSWTGRSGQERSTAGLGRVVLIGLA